MGLRPQLVSNRARVPLRVVVVVIMRRWRVSDYLLRDLELFLIESRACIGCPSGPACLDGTYDGPCGVNERRARLLRRIQGEPNRRASDEVPNE